METKELKIQIPEGYEIDKENSSFEKIVFKKKEEDTKPRSWEEYCYLQKCKHAKCYYMDKNAYIINTDWNDMTRPKVWRSVLPSKELAEAFRAMMQLMSLRQSWIGDWEPDWSDGCLKHCIICFYNKIDIDTYCSVSSPLSFPTREMAEDFTNCFKDLLNAARPLI